MDLRQYILNSRKFRKEKLDEDYCDIWNEKYLANICFILAFLCTATNYVGNRMTCAIPLDLPGAYSGYVMNSCWLNNTYYYPLDKPLGVYGDKNTFSIKKIQYYPLIPVILTIAGGVLLGPSIIYRCLAKKSGIDLSLILNYAKNIEISNELAKGIEVQQNEHMRQMLYNNIARNFNFQRRQLNAMEILTSNEPRFLISAKFWSRDKDFLIKVFLMKKILNIIAAILVAHSFHTIFGSFWMMGIDFMIRIFLHFSHGDFYTTSKTFPLFSICDLTLPPSNGYTESIRMSFECIMTKNVFFDMFFSFLWLVVIWTILINTINLFLWWNRLFGYKSKLRLITKAINYNIPGNINAKNYNKPLPSQIASMNSQQNPQNPVNGNINEIKRRKELMVKDLEVILSKDALLCAIFIGIVTRNDEENIRTFLVHLYVTREIANVGNLKPRLSYKKMLNEVSDKNIFKMQTPNSNVFSSSKESLTSSQFSSENKMIEDLDNE